MGNADSNANTQYEHDVFIELREVQFIKEKVQKGWYRFMENIKTVAYPTQVN